MLEKGISLLEGVLHDPKKARAVWENPGGGFNVYSLLTGMYEKQERWGDAECAIRSAIKLAELERAMTGKSGDLLEGHIELEIVLRAQGKMREADDVEEERKKLVKESLEKVAESEDST